MAQVSLVCFRDSNLFVHILSLSLPRIFLPGYLHCSFFHLIYLCLKTMFSLPPYQNHPAHQFYIFILKQCYIFKCLVDNCLNYSTIIWAEILFSLIYPQRLKQANSTFPIHICLRNTLMSTWMNT